MTTSAYNRIQDSINNLVCDDSTDAQREIMNRLHSQFNRAGAAQWTTEELDDLIKGEDDCLEGEDQESIFYEEVRNIQDDIIGFFGE